MRPLKLRRGPIRLATLSGRLGEGRQRNEAERDEKDALIMSRCYPFDRKRRIFSSSSSAG
jgi:hypothetical protein